MDIKEMSPGDTVFVDVERRSSIDNSPMFGECLVINVFPNHLCGPCLFVRDAKGEQMVLWSNCIPLGMIRKSGGTRTITIKRNKHEY